MSRLERELKTLLPKTPSALCRERIRQEMRGCREGLHAPAPSPRRVVFLPWLGAAAGVVLLAAAALHLFPRGVGTPPSMAVADTSDIPPGRQVRPVFAQSELLEQDNEGVEFVEGIGPVRRYRIRTLEQVQYEFADTGERYWDILPSDHLVFVAVQLN